MDKVINRFLSNVVLGQLQQFRNMGLVPLFNSLNHGPDYLTLGEASALNYLTLTEAEPNGAGPRFKLMNRLPMPVLALRGALVAGLEQRSADLAAEFKISFLGEVQVAGAAESRNEQ